MATNKITGEARSLFCLQICDRPFFHQRFCLPIRWRPDAHRGPDIHSWIGCPECSLHASNGSCSLTQRRLCRRQLTRPEFCRQCQVCCLLHLLLRDRRLGEPARSAVQTPALPSACGGGDGRGRVAAHRRAGGAWMLRAADADSGGADHAVSAVRAAIAMPSSISSMPTARMDRSA